MWTDWRITHLFNKRRLYRFHRIYIFLCIMMSGFRHLNSMGNSWLFTLNWYIFKGNIKLIIMVYWTSHDCLIQKSYVWFIYCGKASCLIMVYWMRLSLHNINIITQIGSGTLSTVNQDKSFFALYDRQGIFSSPFEVYKMLYKNISWLHTKTDPVEWML